VASQNPLGTAVSEPYSDTTSDALDWHEATALKLRGGPHGILQPGAMVVRNARRFPSKIAYVVGDQRVTFAEVDESTSALAYGLLGLGIRPRDRVALIGDNSLEFVYAEFAAMKLGASVVLVAPSLTAEQMRAQLNHAKVTSVVSTGTVREHLREVEPGLSATLFVTWGADSSSTTVADLIQENRHLGYFPIAEIEPTDAALILYTSGTTGTPKGAVNSYFDLAIKLLTNSISAEYKENEVGLVITPLCMGGTQVLSFLNYAMVGMTCVIAPTFNPGKVLEVIAAEHVSTMLAVPSMTTALVNHPLVGATDLSSIERIYSAGATLPREIFDRLRSLGLGVCEIYGSSETGGGVVISAAEKEARPASVGRPKVGHEVRVVDDAGNDLPVGEVGEFIMRGDPVTAGYYEQPEMHAESFAGGWFHTGDLGYRDEEGFFYVIDRKKDMIISGGTNVYPRDVEEVLFAIPGVVEAGVVGLPHAHWGEAVTAFVVTEADTSLTEEAIIAICKQKLAGFQVPKRVLLVDSLPKTAMGKLSKVDLRASHASAYETSEVPKA
jgi:long-chain acyl-CoA synthetase